MNASINDEKPVFEFRGSRDYLSGTTVFDWILSRIPEAEKIDFQFHKFTNLQCIPVSKAENRDSLVAMFRCTDHIVNLVETTEPIVGTYPCNENEIVRAASFSDESAEFDVPPVASASFLESVVAVYKQILGQTADGQKGKLIFGRVKLDFVPTSGSCVVKHRRKIGEKFFEATIMCDHKKIGALYFGQN